MERLGTLGSVDMSSSSISEQDADARQAGATALISISIKTRVSLLSILSNLHSCAASTSIQSLMLSMETFYRQSFGSTSASYKDSEQDQFLVAALIYFILCMIFLLLSTKPQQSYGGNRTHDLFNLNHLPRPQDQGCYPFYLRRV